MRNTYKIFIGILDGKRPVGKFSWEVNIKIALKGMACKNVD